MAWSATFAPDAGSARRARAWLDDALAGSAVAASVRGDALLVASELTANAVRHARTEFTISVSLDGETLRIEVFDRDTRPPALLGLDDEIDQRPGPAPGRRAGRRVGLEYGRRH